MMVKVFANGTGDRGSIPGGVRPKTQKMVLNASLINTQHHDIRIKSKWSNPGKGVVLIAIERGAFGWLSKIVS